ncbi:MAG: Hsp70 family protein [Proteobacteria bacterium]|nr:Hsp70 family protein [Pseudomonadota bacterium]
MNKTIFGLDFGTTNSALSINNGGSVKMVDIHEDGVTNKTLKSVVYYDPEEKEFFVGQKAVNQYVDNDGYGRYIQSIKTFLPDSSFSYTTIGNKKYTLEDLISMILSNIKKAGEELINEEVNEVVLGRPVVFSENPENDREAQNRLIKAAKIAGFKHIHMQYEPIAAALFYESQLKENEEKIVLVGDFGGGTSDFTVIKVKGGKHKSTDDRKEDILSIGGVYIGGNTFDSIIMWDKIAKHFGRNVAITEPMFQTYYGLPYTISSKLRQWHLMPQLRTPAILNDLKRLKAFADNDKPIQNLISLVEDNHGYMLFQSIEKAKVELSSQIESDIIYEYFDLQIMENITRAEFNASIIDDVEKIISCVESVITDADIDVNKIDEVLLTGGSSYIPFIQRYFKEKFGQEKVIHMDAFTSVAHGLGIYGNSVS